MNFPHLPPIIPTVALALLGLFAPTQTFASVYNITEDTEFSLTGTFSTGNTTSSIFYSPTTFAALPGTPQELFLNRGEGASDFGSSDVGLPNDPYFQENNQDPQGFSFLSLSGHYTNGGFLENKTVDWSFWNLTDTGGSEGTFSGNFSFVVRGAPVPDTGSTFAMMGAAFLGLGLIRRKFAA